MHFTDLRILGFKEQELMSFFLIFNNLVSSDFVEKISVLLSTLQHRTLINRERFLEISPLQQCERIRVYLSFMRRERITSGALDMCTAARGSATARR